VWLDKDARIAALLGEPAPREDVPPPAPEAREAARTGA
jgi:hypothetical protein